MMGCNMNEMRFLEIKQDIFGKNNDAAAAFRSARKEDGMLYIDVMASPGAGKTTLLLTIMAKLRERGSQDLAVIEADLESDVDALKSKEAGVDSVELNTRGVCHVEMGMVEKAFAAFGSTSYEYLFLENIGNLVCSADFDTGAHVRVMLLSVPEGWDKVMKYPPMFSIVDALVVTKCDYLPLNPDFDMNALKKQARVLNPDLAIFAVSARTGEGMDELTDWICAQRQCILR